mmetsp:Transcript_17171/g.46501  ORF Transcript_17171/g.46501 Transcript_17171/m.46501 type:complete len:94 (+) Transcript_17171:266-547(+)
MRSSTRKHGRTRSLWRRQLTSDDASPPKSSTWRFVAEPTPPHVGEWCNSLVGGVWREEDLGGGGFVGVQSCDVPRDDACKLACGVEDLMFFEA